jgi:DinB family protein
MKTSLETVAGCLCLVVVLALASVAQTTPAPATNLTATVGAAGPLTGPEREAALKSLQATHDAFLKSIAGLSEKQWRFKPAPDRWSVAEVAEHITISESTLLGLVQTKIMASPATPEKRTEVAGKDELIMSKVPDRSHKAQAPEFLKPTNRWPTEADLTKAFEGERKATIDYVKTTNDDLRDHFGPHPVFGPMDAYQWILLISSHSERHTKQIEEVKADPNFPKD